MKFSFKRTAIWSSSITLITLLLAAVFSFVSSWLLNGVGVASGMLVVFFIVIFGVFFDTLGIAAAAANETPFHAMASEKVLGAKEAIYICRNADRFANFCNDVIGDISGIVSGAAVTIVVAQLVWQMGYASDSYIDFLFAVLFTSVVAALTVGGKAVGKSLAIHNWRGMILGVGKVLYIWNRYAFFLAFTLKSKTKLKK